MQFAVLNCPTMRAPNYGDMYRNGSYAYYSCHYDYVFEDTGLNLKVLHCEYDNYWNGSVTRCVRKCNDDQEKIDGKLTILSSNKQPERM